MVFIPAPQVAQSVFRHTQAGQPIVNVLNWFRETPVTLQNLELLAFSLSEEWAGQIMPFLSASTTFNEVTCRDLTVADGVQVTSAPAATVVGGVGGDSLPANVALCMTHRTAFIGRSRRGRTYFGGLGESSCSGSFFNGTFASDLQDGFTAVVDDVSLLGWQLVIVSRFSNKVPRGIALSTVVTNSSFINLRADSQRGRLPD